MSNASSPPAVGIDLGTTFSAVAHLDEHGRPVTIPNAEGYLTTPSAVFFDRTSPIVGLEALRAGALEPDRLAQFAKRDMGELFFAKTIRGELLPPEVIQALVLKKLKEDAELKLGPVSKAVVTVPAFFNEPCRKATQDAARLADLEILDIINEPTAAAITYGIQHGFLTSRGESRQREIILVYDFGGGTFDATLMEIDGPRYTAIATTGDIFLGGIDFDSRIAAYIAEQYQQQYGTDLCQDPLVMHRLLEQANQAKHALSVRREVPVFLALEGHRFRLTLSRQQFESLTEDLVDRTILTTRMLLSDAGFQWKELTRLLLVGGTTRIPLVQQKLREESGMELDRSVSPDEAVAHGAAVYAGLLLECPESVAAGMSVTNINSHDLGVLAIEPGSGRQRKQVMIPRNTRLPAKRTQRFQTHKDNQTSVKVDIIEGGDDSGQHATSIGKCVVSGLPPDLPKGTPVDVLFHYASNGRLLVKAWLPTVQRDAALQLDRAAGLTPEAFDKWKQKIDDGMPDP